MNCPDCGQVLVETSVTGFDKSFRCGNCGGFWLEGWVANRVADGQMKETGKIVANIDKFINKSNKCPVDGAPLFGYSGEDMPPEVAALKCSHCGHWWFPMDSLFKFKQAYEAKNNYSRFWHKKSQTMMMALPILMVLLLAITTGIVVSKMGVKQEVRTQASVGADEFRAEYLGSGQEEINFKIGKKFDYVVIKRLQDEAWGPVEVDDLGGGWYKTTISGIDEASVYQVQIAGKRYYFKAK